MKFALTKNASLLDAPKKAVKEYTHVECGSELKPADDGQWFCLHCLKTGYLVRKKSAKKKA